MQQYLKENKNTNISKLIYKIRSGTLNIKAWKPWNYEDNLCVMCQTKEENIDHFFKCNLYESEIIDYVKIFENDAENQFKIAKEAEKRLKTRENKLHEIGQDSLPAPFPPDHVSVEI